MIEYNVDASHPIDSDSFLNLVNFVVELFFVFFINHRKNIKESRAHSSPGIMSGSPGEEPVT